MGAQGGAGEWRALVKACERGDVAQVTFYVVQEGVDTNFQHPEIGETPLLAAVKANCLDAVKVLVEKGNADVNLEAEVFSDGSPMTLARRLGFKEIEQYLASKGAEYSEGGSWEFDSDTKDKASCVLF